MPPFDVSPAAPHELLPACRLLFTAPESEQSRERLLSTAAESGVFVARAAGRLCGAALVQAMPGAMGVTVPPRGESAEAEDAVTAAACAWLRERGVKVCQAFAAADEIGAMAPLERYGFRHVTQLVFMRRDPRPERRLRISDEEKYLRITFAVSWPSAEMNAETLLATHVGSLDCPELNAARTPAELVAGFEGAGSSEWYRAVLDGEPVGLALVEFGDDAITVNYLGVVPAARGRGLGSELLGSILAWVTGSQPVTLSVDARNAPAMKLYARHGFVEYDRRGAWLATWPA